MSQPAKDEVSEKFQHKKSLGQNFLTSDIVPNWMCDAGTVTAGDTVVEIGPGSGALTAVLLARGAIVHAIETDHRAVALLSDTFRTALVTGQLILHHADMRAFDLTTISLTVPYKVIANIPYFLSGFLLRTMLETTPPPTTLVFLMQKEMVERITKDPKSSLLSLSVKVYGTPKYLKTVSRGHFLPQPNVDSAILAVTNISHQHLPTSTAREHFFTLLHLGLGSRRKQLIGCLAHIYERDRLAEILATLDKPITVRGEDLSVTDWITLATMLSK